MNPFAEIGKGIAYVAKAFASGVARLFGFARKVEYILKNEKPLEKPFLDGITNVLLDVEELLSAGEAAFTAGGLNFTLDSAGYKAFQKLYADSKALLPLIEDELALLEGKPLPHPLPGATSDNQAAQTVSQPGPSAATSGPGLDKTVPA